MHTYLAVIPALGQSELYIKYAAYGTRDLATNNHHMSLVWIFMITPMLLNMAGLNISKSGSILLLFLTELILMLILNEANQNIVK